jgi:hypothetical protein
LFRSVCSTELFPCAVAKSRRKCSVTFSTSDADPGIGLPTDYTFTAADAGVHTFTSGVTLITPGDQAVAVTDTVSCITRTATVTVVSRTKLALSGAPDGEASLLTLKGDGYLLKAVPKITDFGLAQPIEGGKTLTQSGFLVCTPGYMAPEQASGKRALVGPATDIYALGVMLYQLSTGQLPFQGDSRLEVLRAVIASARVLNVLSGSVDTVCRVRGHHLAIFPIESGAAGVAPAGTSGHHARP